MMVLLLVASAGCMATNRQPFGPHDQQLTAVTPADVDNVTMEATLSGEGRALTVHATARNAGNTTYQVPGFCREADNSASADIPWFAEAESSDSGTRVFAAGGCGTTALKAWPPGSQSEWTTRWTGERTIDCEHGPCSAPSGAYVWTVWFDLYTAAEPPVPKSLNVTFAVTIKDV